MIFVTTSLDIALQRNAARKRTLRPDIATKSWKSVQTNMGKFSQFFRQGFILVDNNVAGEDIMAPVIKQIRNMANAKVKNTIGKQWIAHQLELKKR
jgi:thymidylate kinase